MPSSLPFLSARCGGCDEDPTSLWSADNVIQCQKVSDFLISLAYLSIPLELFYFVTCSAIFPFRWILLQFGSFIVLCGLTHLLAAFTYSPHSFLLFLALTILKFLTALVSLATAVTLVPLIPQLLRAFVRDGLLRQKARDLDRHLGLMRRQEAASWHVRMLTAEIRRSLDRHVILHTTLVHLSNLLYLHDCTIWMPSSAPADSMTLTHQLKRRHRRRQVSILTLDLDVAEIIARKGVVILDPNSDLVRVAEDDPVGPVAAIRMPLLRVSNFKGGTPELVDASYAILVLVLPAGGERTWISHELEIIEVVADQVAVALSHAAVLEESLVMREKLMERNVALHRARQEAILAKEARESFRSVMTQEMAGPIRSVAAILSALQLEELKPEQLAMVKKGLFLSSLVKETTDISGFVQGKMDLRLQPFAIRSIVEEAVGMSRLLCACRGVSFEFKVFGQIPGPVIGDERRILKAVLYMVGNVLGLGDDGTVFLQVYIEDGSYWGSSDSKDMGVEKNVSVGSVELKFEVNRIGVTNMEKYNVDVSGPGHIFSICEKLVQFMDGRISVSQTSPSGQKNMKLVIRLQHQLPEEGLMLKYRDLETATCLFKGIRILLADSDCYNIFLAKKVLEKLECHLSVVSSWFQCLETLYLKKNHFHLLLVDLQILEDDSGEISSRIRKLGTESSLPIVALIPKANTKTRDRCLRVGIQGVICKPVILQEMVEELQRISQQLQLPPPKH